jgi:hypothetical protein
MEMILGEESLPSHSSDSLSSVWSETGEPFRSSGHEARMDRVSSEPETEPGTEPEPETEPGTEPGTETETETEPGTETETTNRDSFRSALLCAEVGYPLGILEMIDKNLPRKWVPFYFMLQDRITITITPTSEVYRTRVSETDIPITPGLRQNYTIAIKDLNIEKLGGGLHSDEITYRLRIDVGDDEGKWINILVLHKLTGSRIKGLWGKGSEPHQILREFIKRAETNPPPLEYSVFIEDYQSESREEQVNMWSKIVAAFITHREQEITNRRLRKLPHLVSGGFGIVGSVASATVGSLVTGAAVVGLAPLVAVAVAAGVSATAGSMAQQRLSKVKVTESDVETKLQEFLVIQSNIIWAVWKGNYDSASLLLNNFKNISKELEKPEWQSDILRILAKVKEGSGTAIASGGGKKRNRRSRKSRRRKSRRRKSRRRKSGLSGQPGRTRKPKRVRKTQRR